MKKLYLDTSAFIKIFVEEEASNVVERLVTLSRDKKVKIALSDWVINESISVIDANREKKVITEVETQQILSEIIDMIEGKVKYELFDVYGISESVLTASRFVIQEYHIGASDALHVFISGAANCDYFVSADEKLIRQLTTGSKKFAAFNVRVKEDVDKLFELIS